MSILLIVGDETRHNWLFSGLRGIPRALLFSYFDPAVAPEGADHRVIRMAGAHDLMAITSLLCGSFGKTTEIAVWNLDPNNVDRKDSTRNICLTQAEAGTLSDDWSAVGREILSRKHSWRPLVIGIDDIQDWYNSLVLGSQHADSVTQQALCERRAGDSLYYAGRLLPVVLVGASADLYQQGEMVGTRPDVPRICLQAAQLVIDVRNNQATVYASRMVSVQVGEKVTPAYAQAILGLPSTPDEVLVDPAESDEQK